MTLSADLKALGEQAIRGDFRKDALNPAEIYRASGIQEGEERHHSQFMMELMVLAATKSI